MFGCTAGTAASVQPTEQSFNITIATNGEGEAGPCCYQLLCRLLYTVAQRRQTQERHDQRDGLQKHTQDNTPPQKSELDTNLRLESRISHGTTEAAVASSRRMHRQKRNHGGRWGKNGEHEGWLGKECAATSLQPLGTPNRMDSTASWKLLKFYPTPSEV